MMKEELIPIRKAFKARDWGKIKTYLKTSHPQFVGREVYYIEEKRGKWFARTDKGWEPFVPKWGWINNIKAYVLFNKIMRTAIHSQIKEIKKRSIGGKCPVTGEQLTPKNIEIHHLTPFSEIAQEFLREKGITVDEVEIKWEWAGKPHKSPLLPKINLPDGFKFEFARYHEQTAELMAVSSKGHKIIHRREKEGGNN